MLKILAAGVFATTLAGCDITTNPPPVAQQPQPAVTRSQSSALSAFARVARQVAPVARQSCRSLYPTAPVTFCDFRTAILNDPGQPPNAFQTIGRDGRPVITFNINMLRTARNDHEIAFVMGHEAGHQIARHLIRKSGNRAAGAALGGILVAIAGGDVQSGMDLGGMIGGRAYSREFELQADTIGTHIAYRAGYDPVIGARSFARNPGSSDILSTHPPSSQRIQTVNNTAAIINMAKSRGRVAPIVW
jgi:predicted Zn-dependent protease